MIQIKNLTKIYPGKKEASVQDISLEISTGDIFGFLGPNGAGKTTTVKMILGLLNPTSGDISLLGSDPHDFAIKKNIGFLPEHPYFYQYLTAREFLHMCAEIFHIPNAEVDDRIEAVLDEVNLAEEARDRKVKTYSKGMQQRLGVAQALINNPKLVILDEPMSGLDPMGRREIKDIILKLKEEGRTVFFNSHILSDVEDLCTKVAIIDFGEIILKGDIKDVTSNHQQSLEKIFIDTITKNRS